MGKTLNQSPAFVPVFLPLFLSAFFSVSLPVFVPFFLSVGGSTITLHGSGFPQDPRFANIKVCGKKCEIIQSSSGKISCLTPPIQTPRTRLHFGDKKSKTLRRFLTNMSFRLKCHRNAEMIQWNTKSAKKSIEK